MGGEGYSAEDSVRMNFVSNYHKTTPFRASNSCTFFSEGNLGEISGGIKRKESFKVAMVTTTSAMKARNKILESGGAILPKRDATDSRIIRLVKANDGKLIDSANDVGGWPELKSIPPPKDTDNDGMPDKWELRQGLDPHQANNNNDEDRDGYTDIEEYLNGTTPQEKNE